MKYFFKIVVVFFSTYVAAYLWGTYDLESNLKTIDSDQELATLGMMPVFLHLYAFGCALIVMLGYGLSALLKAIWRKGGAKDDSNE